MSEISLHLEMPLDDDGFLRRECPLCCREFKVLLTDDELTETIQHEIDTYLLDTEDKDSDEDAQDSTCPYCGQESPADQWWTQEQLASVGVVAQNIMAQIVNEQLIGPLKNMSRRQSAGPVSIQFKGQEMRQEEPWISPEINDMKIYHLRCCDRQIKIADDWASIVHCFVCGFPHEASDQA